MAKHRQISDSRPAFAWRRWISDAVIPLWLALAVFAQSPGPVKQAPAESHGASEPSAPDVLDLVVVDGAGATPGVLLFDAVVKPAIDSAAELEIAEPGGAKLQGGQPKKPFTLRRGGAQSRERVRVDVSDGKPRTVKVRLRLLGADGKPWLIVERQLLVNQPPADPDAQRVPVVQTLPDGTRIVDYMSRKEALARGFPAAGKPAPSPPRPPPGDHEEK